MSFANPQLLFLLIPVLCLPFAFVWSERRRKRVLESLVASPKPALVMGSSFERRLIAMLMTLLGLLSLVLAAARPQWGTKLETVSHRGIDIMLALDVSESMRAQDVSPDRISKARQEVEKFLNLLEGDRVGLIAFAGSAYTYCPLTVDYGAIRLFLSGLQPGAISDAGTDVGSAIDEAIQVFKRSKSTASKVLVLFTDGEHHEKDPMPMVHSAVNQDIQIFTIGIGNPARSGERIPLVNENGETTYKLDQAGNLVISRLDEDTLVQIAEAGNGSYYRVSESGTELAQIYKILAEKQKAEFSSRIHHQLEDRFQIPLTLSLFFLAIAYALGRRSFKKLRRTQGVMA
ncbi:MAG: VWA domain-containing protein [Acidobacteria bacterium]|nr:VWA domain-containing protein [Acidobacteriota bacterium]